MIAPGDRPDDFTLLDQGGTPVAWSSFRGRRVVVFFYPRASTPGCTKEACGFRDLAADFEAAGAAVIGVSADSVEAQAKFAERNELPYPLLSDPEHAILEPWGVWGEKKNYGRTYMGIHRTTVLFDEHGVVTRVWPKVRVKGHVDAVLSHLREG